MRQKVLTVDLSTTLGPAALIIKQALAKQIRYNQDIVVILNRSGRAIKNLELYVFTKELNLPAIIALNYQTDMSVVHYAADALSLLYTGPAALAHITKLQQYATMANQYLTIPRVSWSNYARNY